MKLPVFRTFGNSLGFAFGSYFTVLRLTWLPFAMFIAGSFVVGLFIQGWTAHVPPHPDFSSFTSHLDDLAFVEISLMVLQAIAIAAAAVSVHRVILFGDRKPGVYWNFPFGGTEFFYVLMGVVWILIFMAIMAVVFTPAILLITHGDFTSFLAKMQDTFKNWPPAPGHEADVEKTIGTIMPLMAAYSIGCLIVAYFALRLATWPPAIVATRSFALGEAWALSRGNVLRFLGLFLLVGLLFYGIVAIPAGAAYWYYTTKMKPVEVEQPYDTKPPGPASPVAPGANAPGANPPGASAPGPDAPGKEQKPITNATTITNAPPPPADTTPTDTTPGTGSTPATGDTSMTDAQREAKEEEFRRAFEAGGALTIFLPLFWLIQILLDAFATGLGVALLSYSYKALKGVPARDPITDDA